MENKKYMSIKELMEKAAEMAKADPLFEEAAKHCVLDYDKVAYGVGEDKLYTCQFDVLGNVTFGGSEGIYGDVQLFGYWTKEMGEKPMRTRFNVYTLKTLETTKEAYIGMGQMANLIAYYATEYIMQNLSRFD